MTFLNDLKWALIRWLLMAISALIMIALFLTIATHVHAAPCDDPIYYWSCAELEHHIYVESNGQNEAQNGQYVGLLQISIYDHRGIINEIAGYYLNDTEAVWFLRQPANNLAVGWAIYQQRGWQPWDCCEGG